MSGHLRISDHSIKHYFSKISETGKANYQIFRLSNLKQVKQIPGLRFLLLLVGLRNETHPPITGRSAPPKTHTEKKRNQFKIVIHSKLDNA